MIDSHTFTEGMNFDLAEELLAKGMYRYALNIKNGNSERGAVGVITNAEGNTIINTNLASGSNKVIGAIDDEANDRVIYIVANSEGENRIFAYNYKEGLINRIIRDVDNVLDISPTRLVTSIDVIVDESASYLLFTDDYSYPKNINIDQGIRTYDGNTDGSSYPYKRFFGNYDTVSPTTVEKDQVYSRNIAYKTSAFTTSNFTMYYRAKTATGTAPTSSTSDPFPNSDWEICPAGYIYGDRTKEAFAAAVTPHSGAPETEYTTNESEFNYLLGNLYQFKVKYVMADGRESPWSPISTFINPEYPADSILERTEYVNKSLYNNQISVYVDVPDVSIYKTAKVAVRRVMNDLSPEDWGLAGKVDLVNDLENRAYGDVLRNRFEFDGSIAVMPLNQTEATQLMSWIPIKARTQAVVAGNRVVYANFTEGRSFTVDGANDINQNPPQVNFYERDNPYVSSNPISGYTWNGASTYTPITDETVFATAIQSASGVAFKFPTIVTGNRYSIGLTIDTVPIPPEGNPTISRGATVTLVAESTSQSALVDRFIDAFNTNSNYKLSTYNSYYIDQYLVEATSANSGGSILLELAPTATFSAGSTSVAPTIRRVPTYDVGYTTIPIQSFKRGTVQTFGIVYSDEFGNLSTVIEHPQFSQYNDWWRSDTKTAASSGIAGSSYNLIGQRFAQIRLNHQAPSWATKYHIVKTASNGITNYVSFPLSVSDSMPLLSDGSANPMRSKYFYRGYLRHDYTEAYSGLATAETSLGGQELIYIPLTSLQASQMGYTNLSNAPLAYDYTAGDRVRFCYNMAGSTAPAARTDYYQADFDAEIVAYYTELNAIAIRVDDLPSVYTTTNAIFDKNNEAAALNTDVIGLLAEIYTPQKQKTNEFFYEVYTGDVAASGTSYYHQGNNQNQTASQPAIIELDNGDCFLKPRTYVQKFDSTNIAANSVTVDYFVEEANYYDKVSSKTWGAGRPNRVVRSTSLEEDITGFLGGVQRETTLRYSEPFAPDQGFNGLGTIYDLNFKDTNSSLKSIQHLYSDGDRLYIFHENAVGSAATGKQVIQTLDGNAITIAANTPISDVGYYNYRAGISKNPESFAVNNNRKYFVDVDQGQVCRLSMDGIEPISKQGMDKYFKTVFRDMINSPQPDFAYGAYDKRSDEYIVNLKWAVEVEESTQVENLNIGASGTSVTYTFSALANYDVAVGGYMEMTLPAFSGASAQYNEVSFTTSVSAISGSAVTLAIPTTSALLTYRDQLQDMGDSLPSLDWYARFYPYQSSTLSYSERLKAWSTFYSFKPENMSPAGVDFVSFKEGELYIHNDYDNPHSYYGTDYPAYIDIVSNDNPDLVKVWKTAALKATTEDAIVVETDFLVPVASADTTGSPEPVDGGVEDSRGKITTCQTPVYKEGQIFFPYMKVGTGTSYSGFVTGDKVRGYWNRTRFKINSGVTKIYKIFSANFNYIISNYTR